MTSSPERPLALWLFSCCLMILLMTLIGAVTRLTESGLSITEWNVVMGWLPPLSEAAWIAEFEKYKASPEFEIKHFWMGVEDFKQIFFWEWFHRLWGRLIGLVFIVPLIFFWIRKKIPAWMRPHLLILLALGAAQGYMGWYMVQSGLIDRPSVSHYRLAAHLSLALLIYSLMLWVGLRLCRQETTSDNSSLLPPSCGLPLTGLAALVLTSLTIIWGAFVAGLDAGLIYNSYPLMGDGLVPPDMWALQPPLANLVENHAGVQFVHRWIAIATGGLCLIFSLAGFRRTGHRLFLALGATTLFQIGLGIATLLSQVWLPLAVLHQGGAILLLSLTVAGLQAVLPERRMISP